MKQPLHLSGYGFALMVERGNLIIQDGIAGERRTITLYKDNQEYDHIIIPEYGGSISFEAISWLMVQGIAVTMINPLGKIITSFCPYDHVSGVMKRIQATASQEFKNDIARKILAAKLKGQRQNLHT
jgi:CRISPR/Cas system-associated endonuclease Cas1